MKTLLNKNHWSGLWTALVTPLNSDGSLDSLSLEKLVESQIANGVHGLVIAGSTGEGSLLSEETYKELLKKSKELVDKRVHLVAGVGIGGTEETLKKVRLAKELSYEAILAAPPAYVKAPARGLKKHYLELAKEELAICLYEVPGRAASSIPEELLAELLTNQTYGKYFVAVKDASANFDRLKKWLSQHSAKMAFLSGDDESYPKFLDYGGNGIISVATHFLLPEYKELKNFKKDHFQQKCLPFIKDLFVESNPIPVKSLLHKEGLISKLFFSLPLCPMDASLLQKLWEKWKVIQEGRKKNLEES